MRGYSGGSPRDSPRELTHVIGSAHLPELSRLRTQVESLESEREMRMKLEKLLEVQTVQVDLQKELRVKTESLLQVEQQNTAKLRLQLDDARRGGAAGFESEFQLDQRYASAQQHIHMLEQKLAEATAPETSDRVESQLRHQIEEQEGIIKKLQKQMEDRGARAGGQASEGDVVRLQLLLQSRDRQLDELTQTIRTSHNDSAEAKSEADVLRHQVRVLKKEVSERTEEMERQLNSERNLRADVFQLQASLDKLDARNQEDVQRCSDLAEMATNAEERQRQKKDLELQEKLAEEQVASRREREQLVMECEQRVAAKEQVIRHQTTTIDSLNRELKETKAELNRLILLGSDDTSASPSGATAREQDRGVPLPPLQALSPRAEESLSQRSLESLHRQVKAKDAKIAKQSDRLKVLSEMLEQRDKQLEELASSRRDREQLQQRVREMEEDMSRSPQRLRLHAEHERRLIEQEVKAEGSEQKMHELEDALRREQRETEALRQELAGLRGHVATSGTSTGALREENARLAANLTEVQRVLSGREEELKRVKEGRSMEPAAVNAKALPALQRQLKNLEELDMNLGRDVTVYLQERENKIDNLNSTVSLLRATIDDLQKQVADGTGGVSLQAAASETEALNKERRDNLTLQQELAALRGKAADAGWTAGALQEALAEERSRNEALRQEISSLRSGQHLDSEPSPSEEASGRERRTNEVLQQELAAARGHAADTSLRVSDLQEALDRERRESEALRVKLRAAPVSSAERPVLNRDARDRTQPSSQTPTSRDPARQPENPPPWPSAGSSEPSSPMPQRFGRGLQVQVAQVPEQRRPAPTDVQRTLDEILQEKEALKFQLEEKRQLVMKLVEETNLCNAEVASLQQTLQQANKALGREQREKDTVSQELAALRDQVNALNERTMQEQNKLSNMFLEHQRETSNNAAVDEMDQKLGWKLKVLPPRQHEIRHSVFLVLNRRQADHLDKALLSQGLALHFAIAANRIEIVEDAKLPDSTTGANDGNAHGGTTPGSGSADFARSATLDSQDGTLVAMKRDLVLVNISDTEPGQAAGDPLSGAVSRSAIGALDILDQVRNDMIRGQRIGAIDGVTVDAIFINHGDMVLPFEWPAARAQLLLREGRVLAGKHAVVTVHEIRDPYMLRIVAFDTEVGREFVLYLNTRDVMLLLDTRDHEQAQNSYETPVDPSESQQGHYVHLQGYYCNRYLEGFTVSDAALLDVIVSSLSFSVWQGQQILVASEMRIPSVLPPPGAPREAWGFTPTSTRAALVPPASGREVALQSSLPVSYGNTTSEPPAQQPALLPEVGIVRGLRRVQRDSRRLFEDTLGFEGRVCIFSLVHTTTEDLSEDVLRTNVYYPRTSRSIEACLVNPMLEDRMRIVAEAGELDGEEPFHVVIVVEEVVYPPAFLVRITSVSLQDAYALSPQEVGKAHSHCLRITKDGSTALYVPDISFALSPSTIRTKLLRCIGLSTPIQGPRENMIALPALANIAGPESDNMLIARSVAGHVDDRHGLRVQLKQTSGKVQRGEESERSAAAMPAVMRAQLRAKYGKGRLLKRQGMMLSLHESGESIRVVASVYERPQPYQHFVLSAYEPQTSREWETLADSIDIFKFFADREEGRSQALDLAKPATRERIADVLIKSMELVEREGGLVLAISPAVVRDIVEAGKQDRDHEPEVAGREVASNSRTGTYSFIEPFEVRPAMSHHQIRAIGGLTGGLDRQHEIIVDQHGRDLLFTAQRRLAPEDKGQGELYKIMIYDVPHTTTLHSYMVVAAPLHSYGLAASGLPSSLATKQGQVHSGTYALKVDDKVLEDFLLGDRLLEPSRQEELLNHISLSLTLAEDRNRQIRLALRRKKQWAHKASAAAAEVGEVGMRAPAAHSDDAPNNPGTSGSREIGGVFPLNRMRLAGDSKASQSLQGPSLQGGEDTSLRKMQARDWKKIYCMAQRFGMQTVVITVSKQAFTYKLGVYEPETSSLYEMTLVTSCSSTPMNVLIERCELAGKLDLMLCMNEVAFPHQVCIQLIHVPSSQEFNLKIGDDQVYTMIEASRRESFNHFFEQLITWGCVGFHCDPGTEATALAGIYEETFAGNQIFERTRIEDVLAYHLSATLESGEFKAPTAIAPGGLRKLRVPVIRTQLDFLGVKSSPAMALKMHLLYHAERIFEKEAKTVLMRLHKRAKNNDIALTLRVRNGSSDLPKDPETRHARSGTAEAGTAAGRHFDTPALALAETSAGPATEVTIWLQDKCSRSPCGAHAEICDIPGFSKPVIIFMTDEDQPRAIRVAVTLAQLPFTVLFQVVLLETSEASARVEPYETLKSHSNRKVLYQTWKRYFSSKNKSAIVGHMRDSEIGVRDRDLRQHLDDIEVSESGLPEHVGMEHGEGIGGPLTERGATEQNTEANVAIVHMTTRRKLGRMMVFTVYRDLISTNMYLRVVMHDPITGRDSHLTLLHYTTQRLLNLLRIGRDMLEECHDMEHDSAKYERQQLRAELGKMIVDHIFLQRVIDIDGNTEELDDLELADDDDISYELRMRDIMDSSNSADLTVKKKLLTMAVDQAVSEEATQSNTSSSLRQTFGDSRAISTAASKKPIVQGVPHSLVDLKEDHLLHKGEKDVSGRRVLVTFYNETTKEDILNYSHNIRIVVACTQTLEVLAAKDFHEETLESLCARRGKRHLMSATREHDLVQEMWECLTLEHTGQQVTGISFLGES